ncbi:hypothetical protein C2U60_08405 [Klebsiella variicola]|nr:hypothetical protein [Klebsiella variicola]
MFDESGFTHGDLLRGHNQYVGRSLNVNGSFYRDAYMPPRQISMSGGSSPNISIHSDCQVLLSENFLNLGCKSVLISNHFCLIRELERSARETLFVYFLLSSFTMWSLIVSVI